MSNIHVIINAPPDKHRDIVAKINTWKYPISGKHFRGRQSPYISEIKSYEIRIPDEIEAEFVRDFDIVNPEDFMAGQAGHAAPIRFKILQWLFKQMRKLTPYKPVVAAKGEKKYKMVPWYYAVAIGKLKRQPVKTEVGTEREVL